MNCTVKAAHLTEFVYDLFSKGWSVKRVAKHMHVSIGSVQELYDLFQGVNSCFEELERCKVGKPEATALLQESLLLGFPPEDFDNHKRMTIDPLSPICDICGPTANSSFGGVALLESDGTFTIECQSCWESITSKPKELRVVNTWWKRFAESASMGLFADCLYEWFDSSRRFDDNVRDFMVRQGDDPETFCKRCSFKSSGLCVGCMKLFQRSDLIKCPDCNVTIYCGKKCLELDQNRHKIGCNAYLNSLKTQKQYALPKESEKCEGCRGYEGVNGIRLSKCSKCMIASYCSKNCQAEMWSLHKPVCQMIVSMTKRRK